MVVTGHTMTAADQTRHLPVQNSVPTEFNENLSSLFVDIRSRVWKDERGFRLEHSLLCEEYMTIQNKLHLPKNNCRIFSKY